MNILIHLSRIPYKTKITKIIIIFVLQFYYIIIMALMMILNALKSTKFLGGILILQKFNFKR